MKRSFFSLLILFLLGFVSLHAQKQINIKDVQIVNLGDGKQYIHERDDSKKVIDGKIRLITGVTTEYSEGIVTNGYFEGPWNYYRKNNLQQTANFKDGYLDGKQIFYDDFLVSGDIKKETSYKKGLKDGDWIDYNRNGDKVLCETYANNRLVKRTKYYLIGNYIGNIEYIRNFKNGEEDGLSIYYTENGEIKSEENFEKGELVGKQKKTLSSNLGPFLRLSNYTNGKLDGDYAEYWLDYEKPDYKECFKHPKTKGKYLKGDKDGKWSSYERNGTETLGVYNKGILQK